MPLHSINDSVVDQDSLNVVLIEDDLSLRDEIADHLSAHGFNVYGMGRASDLENLHVPGQIHLYVIDLNLPGESGLSLSNRLRSKYPLTGIVIITAKSGLNDKLAGYMCGGADFYLIKPLVPEELVLVLQNLGRKIKKINIKNAWSLNPKDRILLSPLNTKLRLTGRERTLLVALAQAKDNTLESGQITDLFTSSEDDDYMSKHALEEFIARLRRKLKSSQDETSESAIKSVWGIGYQLCIHINIENVR